MLYFNPLSPEAVLEIADLRFADIEKRLRTKGIHLEISKGVLKSIAEKGYSDLTGAHNLNKTVDGMILSPISRFLLKHPESRRIRVVLSRDRVEVRP